MLAAVAFVLREPRPRKSVTDMFSSQLPKITVPQNPPVDSANPRTPVSIHEGLKMKNNLTCAWRLRFSEPCPRNSVTDYGFHHKSLKLLRRRIP